MTEFRIGDIVKIERGEEGVPGHLVKVVTVVKGRTWKDSEMPLPEVERHREKSSVTVIKRATQHGTALVKYDGEIMPVLVNSGGMITLPTGDTLFRKGIDEDSFIATCPYVPLELIEEAESWIEVWADRKSRNPADILADIVKAVRKYRDGTP